MKLTAPSVGGGWLAALACRIYLWSAAAYCRRVSQQRRSIQGECTLFMWISFRCHITKHNTNRDTTRETKNFFAIHPIRSEGE